MPTFPHIPTATKNIKTKYRTIKTKIPVPQSLPFLNKAYRYEISSMHGQMPIIWNKAENFQISDQWGNKWIDFSSTIFVSNAGHGNKRIIKALTKTLSKPLLHTYTYTSPERIEYLEYLIKNTPPYLNRAFLLSAGTEATEAGLKIMRLNARKNKKRNPGIVSFEGNWHGRTMGAQFMCGNDPQKEWIGYDDPNMHRLKFPYYWIDEATKDPKSFFLKSIKVIEKQKNINFSKDICGIILETFQGWGAIFYPKDFVKAICNYAKKNNILICFDEMQAGFGRTGKLFGYMHYGVKPDLVCAGKGASSSLPLSLLMGNKSIMNYDNSGLSSTHSANPLTCAAGHANLKALIEDGLIINSSKLGKLFHKRLNDISKKYKSHLNIEVNGKGLVAGIIFKNKDNIPMKDLCKRICWDCLLNGLIVVFTGRESIKLAPPLSINLSALNEGLDVFEKMIGKNLINNK